MAIKYYNNAADTSLLNTGNWWNDAGFTDPAGSVPSVGDDAVITADAASGSISVDNITISGGTFATTADAGVAAIITTGATIDVGASITAPIITVSGTAALNSGTLLSGAVSISGSIENNAEVIGSLALSGAAANLATVTGNLTNSGSGNNGGAVSGNYTITSNGTNLGGNIGGTLTVPGTQSGDKITSNISFSNLGICVSLAISGIKSGGGPLGGPAIEF